jgi:RNA polymerase sigma-70 factor (ECF subfamily)
MVAVPPDPPSAELVSRIRAGDRAAFEQVFRRWYAPLADYASQILQNRDAAEDAVQDAFIAVWNRRDALPDAATLNAYLYRAVRNRALNQLRGQKGMASLDDDDSDEPSVEPSALAAIEHAELADVVTAAISALAPRTREVFLLSREQELTYAQIAETLGISVKTVETLMGRALRALRATLRPRTNDS